MSVDTKRIFDNFLKTAQSIVTHFADEKNERDRVLNELEEIAKENCAHQLKNKNVTNTIKEITDKNDDFDQVLELFKDKKKEIEEYTPNVSNLPHLNDYLRQVKELVENADGTAPSKVLDDDDIEMTPGDLCIIDPFTKKRMVDPVKNKTCGHVYERDSVVVLMKMNKNTRCPVVGCINKHPILMENLVTDIMTRKYLHDNPESQA